MTRPGLREPEPLLCEPEAGGEARLRLAAAGARVVAGRYHRQPGRRVLKRARCPFASVVAPSTNSSGTEFRCRCLVLAWEPRVVGVDEKRVCPARFVVLAAVSALPDESVRCLNLPRNTRQAGPTSACELRSKHPALDHSLSFTELAIDHAACCCWSWRTVRSFDL